MKIPAFQNVPEKVFLVLALFYGMLFLLATPPFQVADEPNHFLRAFQVSEGQIVAEGQDAGVGGSVPASLIRTITVFDGFPFHVVRRQNAENIVLQVPLPLESGKRVFVSFPNTALYSPIPYLPQAAGIAAGRVIGASPIVLVYLGRLCNLVMWILLVYCALRIVPLHKWVFFLLALTPMSLFQAASLSADAVINGLAFLAIALILRSSLGDSSRIKQKELFLILVVSVALSLSKQAYFLIPFLCFLIPKERFATSKRYLLCLVLLVISSLGVMAVWSFVVKDLYRAIFIMYRDLLPGVAPERQIQFILCNPASYSLIAMKSFLVNGMTYLGQMIGQLGWLDLSLPAPFKVSYVILVLLVALAENEYGMTVTLLQRAVVLLVLVASTLLIGTLMYITANPVGGTIIGGLQGRYFIPLSPLFFLLWYNNKSSCILVRADLGVLLGCFTFSSLAFTVYKILQKYYPW